MALRCSEQHFPRSSASPPPCHPLCANVGSSLQCRRERSPTGTRTTRTLSSLLAPIDTHTSARMHMDPSPARQSVPRVHPRASTSSPPAQTSGPAAHHPHACSFPPSHPASPTPRRSRARPYPSYRYPCPPPHPTPPSLPASRPLIPPHLPSPTPLLQMIHRLPFFLFRQCSHRRRQLI
ncbi:hypothetical protein HD554DRAFT_429504 [Boletus coccyginus]|nr:hypothetical protein HD554DRAFT_429504 [Boletus coccyginus]